MGSLLDKLVNECVRRQIVASKDSDWLRYGLEKRLAFLFVGIPFFVFAIILSNLQVSSTFFFAFLFLRSRTNGHHAKTLLRCLWESLALEILFLGFLCPIINNTIIVLVMAVVVVLVFALAPYNHPNMHLTAEEVAVCKISARNRICVLTILTILSVLLHLDQLSKGIALGCAMAGLLLCLAYIINKTEEYNNGECTSEGKKSAQQSCKRND